MIASRLRLILSVELIAYFFAAPYIILLGLDETRGLLDASYSMNTRLWAYALLVGIYPFLLMIVSPYIGRQLDQRSSKISVLRKIHFANSVCYLLLGVAAFFHSYWLGITALCIPGMVGCAAPVGKSLIAGLTKPEVRVQEFGKLAFLKGVVKLTIPLLGAFIFKILLNESSYTPLFCFSSFLSLSCFIYSFSFPDIHANLPPAINCQILPNPTFTLLKTLVRKNYPLLIAFVLLITGYSVFIKFTPFVLFETLGDNPSIVNYFASLVGLAYTVNQFILVRYADRVAKLIGPLLAMLCTITVLLSFTSAGPLWFLGFFAVLFCFSILNTCIEARLSLQGVSSNQGAVQGIVYSVENWGYIIAPIMGSFIAGISRLYPLYFVTLLAAIASIFFAYSQLLYKRSQRESYT
ncbi:MAG: MFS transporter [Chlamydiales bacterium]|nr:MFS transporter [Chlamydiales bacterium]